MLFGNTKIINIQLQTIIIWILYINW